MNAEVLAEIKARHCEMCGLPYHRYCDHDPEHDWAPVSCINGLRAEVERLQEGLRAILREHHEVETHGGATQCCTCGPQEKRWPCTTVLEALAALGGEE